VLGAGIGIDSHLRIGDGAQVTAMSAVKDDIPADGRWVERPARGGSADTTSEGLK